jgi:hypothetical protein
LAGNGASNRPGAACFAFTLAKEGFNRATESFFFARLRFSFSQEGFNGALLKLSCVRKNYDGAPLEPCPACAKPSDSTLKTWVARFEFAHAGC